MEAVDAPIMAGCMSKIVLALSTCKQTKTVGLHLYPRTQGIRLFLCSGHIRLVDYLRLVPEEVELALRH